MKDIKEIIRKVLKEQSGLELGEAKKKKAKRDACYHKVKSRYKVWPSAYVLYRPYCTVYTTVFCCIILLL